MKFKLSDYRYPVEILRLYLSARKSIRFSREQLLDVQNQKLRAIISHAYAHVPYYREVFDATGLKPRDISTVADLVHIPALSKETVRERYADLIADNSKIFRPYENRTSGSTGTPLRFLQDKNVSIARFTFFLRAWQMAGYRPYMRWAQVDGMFMHEGKRLWRYNRALNSLQISAFALNEANCAAILQRLKEFSPRILRGYPSALYTLAQYQPQKGDLRLRSIITYAEKLHDYQRELLERRFNCGVFDTYSSWEGVCLISECEAHRKHQHMEYSAMELLDAHDNPAGMGESGEITGTSFYNFAMPFIRYKTGDLATLSDQSCPCGRNHLVIDELEGRSDDMIITPGGERMSRLSNAFACVSGFDYAQIVQNTRDALEVHLVKNHQYEEGVLARLEGELRKRIGSSMKIDFKLVDDIKPSSNGKRRLVVNNYLKEGK